MTNDCVGKSTTNHIIKYADDTTVVGLIMDWCNTNNLLLNVGKSKEIIADFRKSRPCHSLLHIDNTVVEAVEGT